MPSCNCVTVAVYCVIALFLTANYRADKILFNALMHDTVNTGLYRISNLRQEFSIFQHSEWMDQVVTGNCKEMCYEGVHWFDVAHEVGFANVVKWLHLVQHGDKPFRYVVMTQMCQGFG